MFTTNISPLLILCGGHSSRMGSPKALLPYRNRPLIAYQIANAAPHRPVWLAADQHRYPHTAPAQYLPDQLPNKQGALSAIAPALAQAQAQGYAGLYILSCDTLIPPEALIAELNTAAANPAFTQGITALQDGDQLLPLLAHWSAQLAGSLKTTVAQGNKRVQHYVKSQPHQTLPLPPQWRTIAHFNTPQEYAQAQQTAQQLHIYADANP